MTQILTAALLSLCAGSGHDSLAIDARLAAEELTKGGEYEIVIKVKVNHNWSASESGLKTPLLQIKVPRCAKLVGKVLKEYRELSRNEFLRAPYEQFIKNGEARIRFKLTREPSADDAFAFNVLAYVYSEESESHSFVRRRIELPVAPGAVAEPVESTPSDWGRVKVLQLGDKAPVWVLPRADGTKLVLRRLLGKKNVIITTYRAHW